jgi:hypothetical protein
MKRIFALALVSLLSISSLANQDPPDLSNELLPPDKISCPAEFTEIYDKKHTAGGDFCISNTVQKDGTQFMGVENCEKQVHDDRKAWLCDFEKWTLACKQAGKRLKMGKANGGSIEWTYSNYIGTVTQQAVRAWDCDLSRIDRTNPNAPRVYNNDYANTNVYHGSRCCLRVKPNKYGRYLD